MTTESTTAEIPELNREISVCKQTQSWSPLLDALAEIAGWIARRRPTECFFPSIPADSETLIAYAATVVYSTRSVIIIWYLDSIDLLAEVV